MSEQGRMGLNWVRTGTEHAETVVLVHGVGLDLTYWDRQIEALRGRYNVVAMDLPGHGRSGWPDGGAAAEGWTFGRAVAVVGGLIESLEAGPVHLVGISFGGMVVQEVVLARPELVRSVVLVGTAAGFAAEVQAGMRARAALVRREGMAAVVGSSMERWFTAETRLVRPDVVDRLTKTLLGDDAAVHAAVWELIGGRDGVAGFGVRERLGEIGCAALVVVGEEDPSTRVGAARELVAGIRGARLVVVPGASHMVSVEAPVAVNAALLGFLAAVGGERD